MNAFENCKIIELPKNQYFKFSACVLFVTNRRFTGLFTVFLQHNNHLFV